jgi:hypothetical protein
MAKQHQYPLQYWISGNWTMACWPSVFSKNGFILSGTLNTHNYIFTRGACCSSAPPVEADQHKVQSSALSFEGLHHTTNVTIDSSPSINK